LLAVTTFLSGVVLLFSGATPAVPQRMLWLERFLPLPVIEISHFTGSILGIGLLLLARGLQRRIDAAYLLSVILLSGGILVSLLKGFDYEEAIILGVMLAILLPARPYFYRRSSLLGRSLSPAWSAAVLIIIVSSAWLVFFSYKHTDYARELWWQFSLQGDAPRSLRALAGAVTVGAIAAFAKLLRPSPPAPRLPRPSDLDRLAPIVAQSPDSTANLVFLGDKDILVSPSGQAFLMYAISGRSWVALGDPVGNKEEWKELVWQFQELCDRHGGWTVFYQVREESLPVYLDLGLTMLTMGEEGRVDLGAFSLDAHANKPLRHWHRTPESEGCTFEFVPVSGVDSLLPDLRPISDAWLAHKHSREKRFSLGRYDETYLHRFPMGVVRHGGRPVAFANIWAGDNREEMSFDLMRHLPTAPAGVMDFLLIELMLWGKQHGYRWFNLGMAPFSGLERHAAGSLWNQWGTFLYRHGEYFYNFQGLRRYKEKFRPVWQPRYLASPGGIATFRVLTQVAALISGGLTGVATK
jgi:phosphatidylglycerol lysyltransferase